MTVKIKIDENIEIEVTRVKNLICGSDGALTVMFVDASYQYYGVWEKFEVVKQ